MNRFWTATTCLLTLACMLLMSAHQTGAGEIATADTATSATVVPDYLAPLENRATNSTRVERTTRW